MIIHTSFLYSLIHCKFQIVIKLCLLLNSEFKVAMELENPVSLGSDYSDPLAVMTSRFNKIKAKVQ